MMSDYYALSELDNAINRTKNLLWPVKKKASGCGLP